MLTGKLFCWGRLDRHQCLLGSFSAEEGWTNINAYWELRHQCLPGALLLRKAGQTPMLLGALCWGRLDRRQCLLGSSSAEKGWTDTNAYWELRHQCLPGALLLRKAGQTPMLLGALCWGRLDRRQCLLGSSSAEECWTDTNAYWELRHQCLPGALLLRKAGQTPMLTGSSDTNAYQDLFSRGRLDRHQCSVKLLCAEEGWADTNAYWEAPLLRKARQTPMLTRKLLCWGRLDRHQCSAKLLCAEEGWADTSAYWEAPLLRKAGQTPMLTGKLLCWGGLDRHQCLLGSSSAGKAGQTPMLTGKLFCWGRLDRHQCLLWSSSAEEGWTDTNAYWKTF